MKTNIIIVTILLASLSLSAQEGCYTYFPSQVGNEWSYKSYDRRDRLTGSSLHTIAVENTGGMTVKSISFDDEGEPMGYKKQDGTIEVLEVDYEVYCINGELHMTPESLTHSFTNLFEGLEAEVSGDNFLVSSETMDTDTTLPDYRIKIKVNAASLKIEISVSDRTVLGNETLATPAGTFNCIKLQQNTGTKLGFINKNHKTVVWIAPGVGMVKSETYNRSDRLVSKTVLDYKNW